MRFVNTILILLTSLAGFAFNGPFIDMVYHPDVKTVQIYPAFGSEEDDIKTAVKPLNHAAPFILEFDLLGEEQDDLMFKIIHLNKDWWVSNRTENEYLNAYNEFRITDVQASFNTKIDYIHYTAKIPQVTLSGNYLVVVYKENEPKQVYLTRRFVVYEDIVSIIHDNTVYSGTVNTPFQYLNFNIDYTGIENLNPSTDFFVMVRKNGNYNQEHRNVKPTFIDVGQRSITYNLNNKEDGFIAGNQFRTVDMRSNLNAGINVQSIDNTQAINVVTLMTDEPRKYNTLPSTNDINGRYRIDQYEFGEGDLNSDYVYTYFILKAAKARVGSIYVHGALSNWTLEKEFKMIYDEENQFYYCRPLLKQGYYNYEYILAANYKNIDYGAIEGSFNLAENIYEVFLYIKKPGTQNERLVGYHQIKLNATR